MRGRKSSGISTRTHFFGVLVRGTNTRKEIWGCVYVDLGRNEHKTHTGRLLNVAG